VTSLGFRAKQDWLGNTPHCAHLRRVQGPTDVASRYANLVRCDSRRRMRSRRSASSSGIATWFREPRRCGLRRARRVVHDRAARRRKARFRGPSQDRLRLQRLRLCRARREFVARKLVSDSARLLAHSEVRAACVAVAVGMSTDSRARDTTKALQVAPRVRISCRFVYPGVDDARDVRRPACEGRRQQRLVVLGERPVDP
jgi:hypothetical protein